MQTNDQYPPNCQRISTTAHRYGDIPLYKSDDVKAYRHIKPSRTSVEEISNSKVKIEGKLTEFDLFRAIQQHSGGLSTVNPTKANQTNNFTSTSHLHKLSLENGTTTSSGKVRKLKSNTSPSKKSHIGNQQFSQNKRILPKTSNPPVCEVKKFAPEINGLLTDLSTALKISHYSNHSLVTSATYVTSSKPTSVYQSAKTTAKTFNRAKYNLLFGQKNFSNHPKLEDCPKLDEYSKQKTFNSKKSSPEELRKLHNTNISTTEYLKNLKSRFSNNANQTKIPYQSLSKFFSEPKSKVKYENRSAHEDHTTDMYTKTSQYKSTMQSYSKSQQDMTNEKKSAKVHVGSINEIPELLRDSNKKILHERKSVITPTPVIKMEAIKGFNELYENAVKNLLSIDVFPSKSNPNSKNTTMTSSLPLYRFDKEIEAFMNTGTTDYKPLGKDDIKLSSTTLFENKTISSFSSEKVSKANSNSGPAFSFLMKVNENELTESFNTNIPTFGKVPTPKPFVGYTLTELLDTNDQRNFQNEKLDTRIEKLEKTLPPLQTDLSWLYSPFSSFKNFPPPLPPQPTYLQNVFLPYQDHVPKISTIEVKTEIKPSKDKSPNTSEIIKTSTPIPPDSPPTLPNSPPTLPNSPPTLTNSPPSEQQSDAECDEVRSITNATRRENVVNGRRNTSVTPVEKKSKSLKYRPYRLRDRIKSSKKVKELMAELAKEPAKPKYLLKDIDQFSSRKEIFLGELGLRMIIQKLIEK